MKTLAWICLVAFFPILNLLAEDPPTLRKENTNLHKRGMWRDAIDHYSEKLLPIADGQSGADLSRAVTALGNLDAWREFDGLVERAVAAQAENPALLLAAVAAYRSVPHVGQIVAGDFERMQGYRHQGRGAEGATAAAGQAVATDYRDRVRSLQLLQLALAAAKEDSQRLAIWQQTAAAFPTQEAWKLQTLTPLETLPEWGEPGPEGGTEGAPWAGDRPVLYEVPASWGAAKNDGERWRFALAKTPGDIAARAQFSQSQFGTETLSAFGWWRQQDPDSAKGILEMDTLAEDECLAKTSDGVRRFKLPAEHHFIALYRSILDQQPGAGDDLVQVFLNRRQYDKAQEVLEKTIARHGPGDRDHRKDLLLQITGNWGRFEPAPTVPAGVKPKLPLVFRNASTIKLTAAPVAMDDVIRDTISYLQGNPRELDWQRVNPSTLAQRLIAGSGAKYIGPPAATWETRLTPRDKHRDTRVDLEVPLDQAGAWWITGSIAGGNTFHTLVWSVDSVLVQNDVAGQKQWWVADANSGAPVAEAEIEFFGYRTIHLDRKLPLVRNMEVRTKGFKRGTDADGKTLLKPGELDEEYQWISIARKKGRTPAFLNFHPYFQVPQLDNGNRDLSYGISDRPLYKPGDTAHLKFYLRNVGYFQPAEDAYANRTGTLVISNGRGEEVVKIKNLKTDALGSVQSAVVIPEDGGLGNWNAVFTIANLSASVSLRVEEYRKPEFEVKVEAPSEPVKLGGKFTATVKATYFHGSPVRNATVEIIVKRGSIGERWFPAGRWDWLYGPGAWWSGSDASWHPGWQDWGCMPPHPPWWQGDRFTPDELVLKRSVPIGPDGTALVEIDTAPAKEIHGDLDARYTIEARVVDASRREERGTGSVIAARKPFEVIVWTDRGHSRAGEQVEATISAATLAGKPVVGAKGKLTIYQLTGGAEGRIEEKETQSFPIETDAQGEVKQRFAAPATGQYRLGGAVSPGSQYGAVHSGPSGDPSGGACPGRCAATAGVAAFRATGPDHGTDH